MSCVITSDELVVFCNQYMRVCTARRFVYVLHQLCSTATASEYCNLLPNNYRTWVFDYAAVVPILNILQRLTTCWLTWCVHMYVHESCVPLALVVIWWGRYANLLLPYDEAESLLSKALSFSNLEAKVAVIIEDVMQQQWPEIDSMWLPHQHRAT